MAIFAFRRMREQNEAAEKAASLVQTQAKPKPKRKSKPKQINGDNS